jgi:hypothetical protein
MADTTQRTDDHVSISLKDYNALSAKAGDKDADSDLRPWWAQPDKRGWMWVAPEYFSRWRIFPRAFITMYIYLLWYAVMWFMELPEPSVAQSGLISVLVGAGAAWFGLYVNSTSTEHHTKK